MKELEIWDEIKGIGTLNMEMELVVANEPVLFVCSLADKPKEKYLVMTYNSFDGKYVIRKISNQELVRMLENEVTMEQTFRNADEILLTHWEEADYILEAESCNPDEFSEKMLPKKGTYYNIHSKYILDYMETLKEESYSLTIKVGQIQYGAVEMPGEETGDIWMSEILNKYSFSFDSSSMGEYQGLLLENNSEIVSEVVIRAA